MGKEIIINASEDQTRIAILESKDLVELYIENPDNTRTIGDIYLSRIRKVMPSIQAAFVDIGQKQDAFLHFSDISDNLPAIFRLLNEHFPEPKGAAQVTSKKAALSEEFELEDEGEDAAPESDQPKDQGKDQAKSAPRKKSGQGRTRGPKQPSERKSSGKSSAERQPSGRSSSEKPSSRRQAAPKNRSEPAEEPPSETPETGTVEVEEDRLQQDQQESASDEQQPKKRRGRRRGRRRGKSKGGEGQADESGDAETSAGDGSPAGAEAEASTGEAGEQAEKPRRRRGRGKGASNADTSNEGAASEASGPEAAPPDAPPPVTFDGKGFAPGERPGRPVDSGRESGAATQAERAPKTASQRSGSADDDRPPNTLDFTHLEQYLRRDQKILVKITKEPISSKGSRVSTDISLAGRFLVLVPMADYVAVSKKIVSPKERRRLRSLAQSLLPKGFGVIVRTVAEGRDAKALDTDLRLLVEKWRKIEEKLKENPAPPVLLYQDVSLVSSMVRDLFTDDYDRILVDDPRLYRNIRSYVQAVAPHMASVVQLHKGPKPIFEACGIDKAVAEAFDSRVTLPSGGYLFIERTEAMHVVDVNSGRSGRGMTQEQSSLRVNLEAARVLARHVRLRDLGGIICVDFIDMRDEGNRRKVYEELKQQFKRDRAVSKILPMSDFGVVQITRQRLRPSLTSSVGQVPGSLKRLHDGTAYPSVAEVVQTLERWLVVFKSQTKRRLVDLQLHPLMAAFLTKGMPDYPMRWFMKYFVRVRLEADESMDPLAYKFVNPDDGKDITDEFDYRS